MYLHTQYRKAKETSTQCLVLGDSSLKFLSLKLLLLTFSAACGRSPLIARASGQQRPQRRQSAPGSIVSGERREREAKSGGGWGGGRPSEGGHDMVGFSKWA